MSFSFKCDRCLKFFENVQEKVAYASMHKPFSNVPYDSSFNKYADLCEGCYLDFIKFIESSDESVKKQFKIGNL